MRRIFYCIVFLLCGISLIAQESVVLKWKLKPTEVLTYRTMMTPIDTDESRSKATAFFKMFGDSANDLKEKEFAKALDKTLSRSNFVTHLVEKRKGVVQVIMNTDDEEDGKTIDTVGMAMSDISSLMKNVSLRGAVYTEGGIESFYLATNQRNLLAVFFELPVKPLMIGDTWGLDVHFTSMESESFICDSSFKKNEVKLVGIENLKGEKIATLEYDIREYSLGEMTGVARMFFNRDTSGNKKTIMNVSYRAKASFSIDRGRWITYEGVMSIEASGTGIMDSKVSKKFALIAN